MILACETIVEAEVGFRLAGFADGEGHFGISRSVRKSRGTGIFNRPIAPMFSCFFSVQQRADDRALVERLRAETGLGSIYDVKAQPTEGRANNPKIRWSIQTKADCRRLVDIFDAYPLWSKKAREYDLWRRAVLRWTSGAHMPTAEWEYYYGSLRELRRFSPAAARVLSTDNQYVARGAA